MNQTNQLWGELLYYMKQKKYFKIRQKDNGTGLYSMALVRKITTIKWSNIKDIIELKTMEKNTVEKKKQLLID